MHGTTIKIKKQCFIVQDKEYPVVISIDSKMFRYFYVQKQYEGNISS
jgi:hypothetical protein